MFARREVVNDEEKSRLITECITHLPQDLQLAARQGPADQFGIDFANTLEWAEPDFSAILEMAYYIDNEFVRPALLQSLSSVELEPNEFQRVRHIFKVAEMRRDAEVFGLLAWRFETTPPNFRMGPRWYYPRRQLPTVGEKPDNAFSLQTRNYLRKRVWRTLRQFGEMNSSDYCRLAAGILAAFRDTDARPARAVPRYHWDAVQRRAWTTTKSYDRFADYVAFNHILYGNSARYEIDGSNLKFHCVPPHEPGHSPPEVREELFPELWNEVPEVVTDLLIDSRCEPVHQFGVKVLQENLNFQESVAVNVLARLLEVPYENTLTFVFELAQRRFDPTAPNADLLFALANCDYAPAREQAHSWLHQCRELLQSNDILVGGLIVSRHQDTRQFSRDWLQLTSLSTEQSQAIIGRVVASLLKLTDSASADRARDICETLLLVFSEPLKAIGIEVIRDLVQHPLAAINRFAAELILRHSEFSTHPPTDVIDVLLAAEDESVRAMGVRIVSQLPDEILTDSVELLFVLIRHEREDIRNLIRPTVARLAQDDSKFGREIASKLVDAMLVPGAPDRVPTFTAVVLRDDLRDRLDEVSADTVWQLVKSRSTPAQDVGGMLLATNIDSAVVSVEEMVRLCHHKVLSVRESARAMCVANTSRLKEDPETAARMIDSAWADTREFAMRFITEHFSSQDALSPEVLVGICDSVRPDVQQFGRELITQNFDGEHGEEYLLKLSEHPAQPMQLFVSNFLEQHVRDNPEQLQQLSQFFVSVLSRVNQGRVAKTRTLKLLEREGLRSLESAQVVGEILSRLSATTAITDRSHAIQAMVALQDTFPTLSLPIERQPLEVRDAV